MTRRQGWRGAALVGLVAAGSLIGAAGAGALADGLDPRCPRPLTSHPLVAVVDSGVAEGSAEIGPTVARIDLTDDPSSTLDPHGTEMAGIIVARAPEARVLDVRVLDDDGRARGDTMAEGVDRAVAAGADIVNISAEVPAGHAPLVGALRRADQEGVAVVLAAGNDGRDLDLDPAWAQLAALRCVVVVGASDAHGAPLGQSNHGDATVDVVASGEDVPTAAPDGSTTTVGGTSAAAAVVTGRLAAR